MSLSRKIRNKAQAISGRARQRFGRATGNRRLKTEGKTDRVLGNLKQSGEKVNDAFKR